MKLLSAFVLLCGVLSAEAKGEDRGETLSGRLVLPKNVADPTPHISGMRVLLNGGEYSTYTRVDGTWEIANVERGKVYLCEFQTGDVIWPTYKIFVPLVAGPGEPPKAINVIEYRYPGAPKIPSSHPITSGPAAAPVFFEERPKMSVWSILKNPQMIMFAVMGAMMFFMPAMQKNMDPEMAREMEAQQAVMSDPMSALTKMLKGESFMPEEAPPQVKDAPDGKKRSKTNRAS